MYKISWIDEDGKQCEATCSAYTADFLYHVLEMHEGTTKLKVEKVDEPKFVMPREYG